MTEMIYYATIILFSLVNGNGYFDTSIYGTPPHPKNWSWHPVPYLEEIR